MHSSVSFGETEETCIEDPPQKLQLNRANSARSSVSSQESSVNAFTRTLSDKIKKAATTSARYGRLEKARMTGKQQAMEETARKPRYKLYVDSHFPLMVAFVDSIAFEYIMGIFIMFNCITIGLEVQMCPPEESSRPRDSCPKTFMFVSEHTCTAIFVVEFFIRGIFLGFSYHIESQYHAFDACLVWVTGVLFNWVLAPVVSDLSTLRMLTALRAFRLLRLIRIVRFEPAFRNCWMLFRGLANSSSTLNATVIVILFVNYLFGVIGVTIIGDSDEFGDSDDLRVVEAHQGFKGLDETLFTLLQILTADAWASSIARPIMAIMPYSWIFFTAYVAFGMIVLLNLVTAIIVENAMESSRRDREERLRELEKNREEAIRLLTDIFLELDLDNSGTIEEEEFRELIDHHREVLDKFKLLDFDDDDIPDLFDDLDDGDGLLDLHEFTRNINAMRGLSKSADMIRVKKSLTRMHKRIDALFEILDPQCKVPPKRRQSHRADARTSRAIGLGLNRKSLNRQESNLSNISAASGPRGLNRQDSAVSNASVTKPGVPQVYVNAALGVPQFHQQESCLQPQGVHDSNETVGGSQVLKDLEQRTAGNSQAIKDLEKRMLAKFEELNGSIEQIHEALQIPKKRCLVHIDECQPPSCAVDTPAVEGGLQSDISRFQHRL